ncbi:hypothetical protein BpHYR1_044275 [Brachionus plicatilis]|uniref:Uncharacterized protein n=1 Tax=Brachionus plicatilis TaxID=10195 RepID=A0A3M7PJI3_BRAPC|nr:hypothetical protein BpHYR1_044275 [Brachionus plicatilis]
MYMYLEVKGYPQAKLHEFEEFVEEQMKPILIKKEYFYQIRGSYNVFFLCVYVKNFGIKKLGIFNYICLIMSLHDPSCVAITQILNVQPRSSSESFCNQIMASENFLNESNFNSDDEHDTIHLTLFTVNFCSNEYERPVNPLRHEILKQEDADEIIQFRALLTADNNKLIKKTKFNKEFWQIHEKVLQHLKKLANTLLNILSSRGCVERFFSMCFIRGNFGNLKELNEEINEDWEFHLIGKFQCKLNTISLIIASILDLLIVSLE